MIRNFIILILITIANLGYSSSSIRALHYRIQARFTPEQAFMSGNCQIDLNRPLQDKDHFFLHGELRVDSVLASNGAIPFSQSSVFYDYAYSLVATRVELHPDSAKSDSNLVVYYHGYFHPSRARSASDYMRIDEADGVLLRSYGYSLWFPIFIDDGGDSYNAVFDTVTVDVPESLRPVVCGRLLNERVSEGRRISIWNPGSANLFDMQCTARPYQSMEKSGIILYYLDDSRSKKGAVDIASFSTRIDSYYKNHYRNTTSEQPLYIMEMPQYGNISSGNVIGISSELWKSFDEHIFPKIVLSHEQVHPYVQSDLSSQNSMYALVIEGFPSYFHLPALATIQGEEWYRKKLQKIEQAYISKRQRHPNGRAMNLKEKPILELTADDISLYKDTFVLNDRVLLFLNHLRSTMGDVAFNSFCLDLFSHKTLDYGEFEGLILKYLPGYRNNLLIWLKTTDFPDAFKISAFGK